MGEKRSIGWHVAGMIFAIILLIVSVVTFTLGIYAFETADYPVVGGYALYAVKDEAIIPSGAAVVTDTAAPLERGIPVAFLDDETEHICVKYYYGEADGKILLADAGSENVTEVDREALRGAAVSTVRYLGAFLNGACSLAGVCISLGIFIVLVFVIGIICASAIRRIRYNRTLPTEEDSSFFASETEAAAEAEVQDEVVEELKITENISMKRLAADENGRIRFLFYGTVTNILKLAQLIRTLAEKMQADSVIVEERYDDYCGLSVEFDEKDLPLIRSIIGLLSEWEEQKPMVYMAEEPEQEKKAEEVKENTEENE
ncbi:MAG: hypothetical protein IKK29_00700 [Christensenellaceae bacterium]|nr:hypothetical protein [Christensenellaceae bacterium]